MKHDLLAAEADWSARDIVCTAGPRDRPFEEQHDLACLAVVTEGTFQYRTREGRALLAPGAILIGNPGTCFECGHEHGVGDRCLSFKFTPEAWERIAAAVPGVRRAGIDAAGLPPLPQLAPLVARAETARDDRDEEALEEVAHRLVGASFALLSNGPATQRTPSMRDEARVTESVRRIEADPARAWPLTALARDATMSPYHYLRVFKQVVGLTPHQFILRARLHRAAMRLMRSNESVLTIALDAGFADLSTFNRRFRCIMGTSPSGLRARGA